MASFYQCPPAHCRGDPSFFRAAADDWRALAERFCCGRVRDSSVACGIGRMDSGAKGRAKRCFLHAHLARIRPLRARALDLALSVRSSRICFRPHVQADARDAPVCAFSPRLLATQEDERFVLRHQTPVVNVGPGKDSTDRPLCRFKHRHVFRPARCGRLDRTVAGIGPNQQCSGKLRRLHLADALASETRRVLPPSGEPATALGKHPVSFAPN